MLENKDYISTQILLSYSSPLCLILLGCLKESNFMKNNNVYELVVLILYVLHLISCTNPTFRKQQIRNNQVHVIFCGRCFLYKSSIQTTANKSVFC